MTMEAIQRFDSLLLPHFIVFEFGAGNSTIWLARRVSLLYSVEDQMDWIELLTKRLKELKLNNVELLFRAPEGESYRCYYQTILRFPDEYFDLILIDGKERVQCIVNSFSKLKTGGILVLDDSDWTQVIPGLKLLKGWRREDVGGIYRFDDGRTEQSRLASFFWKPEGEDHEDRDHQPVV